MVDIAITGDKALAKAVQNLTKREFFAATKKGVRAGTKISLKRIRTLAPKDTGLLKRSIVARVGKRHRPGSWAMAVMINAKATDEIHALSGKVAKGSKRHTSGKGKVGSDYYYPAAQEFGWTRGGRYFPAKSPYMRPGFDQTSTAAGLVIQETSWRKLVELWQRPKGG